MRLTRIAAATLIAGSLTFAGTGIALADTPATATSNSAVSAVSSVSEPGTLMLSAASVRPGAQVLFSGTFAEPAASTATGSITVTSPAFAGPATLSRTNPEAFSGTATVASGTKAGTYTVTASSSAGTVSTKLTVVSPTPAPAHHDGTAAGTHSSSHGSSSGTSGDASTLSAVPDGGSDVLPWVLGGAGVLVVAGGGAFALGRGRRDDAGRRAAQARQDYREPRTEVMTRR
jgi:hypothetical protein